MSKITERINETLKENGISKEEFYKVCKITSSAYSQWNTGKTEPRATSLKKVADFLNVNYQWLLFGDGVKEKPPVSNEQLSDDALKFALFGDATDITDADMEDVRRYAEFIKERKKKDK